MFQYRITGTDFYWIIEQFGNVWLSWERSRTSSIWFNGLFTVFVWVKQVNRRLAVAILYEISFFICCKRSRRVTARLPSPLLLTIDLRWIKRRLRKCSNFRNQNVKHWTKKKIHKKKELLLATSDHYSCLKLANQKLLPHSITIPAVICCLWNTHCLLWLGHLNQFPHLTVLYIVKSACLWKCARFK